METIVQLLSVHSTSSDDILATTDVTFSQSLKLQFVHLTSLEFKHSIYNFCWINAKTVAVLDNTEKLHICDIRSKDVIQVIPNLNESVALVFSSGFFKVTLTFAIHPALCMHV